MRMVDLSHRMNVHTPGWVGYAGNKMYYAQNLQTVSIVAQRIDTALHVGTHIDGAMHATDGMGDMASYPLDFLVGKGAIVDISAQVGDWDVITPAMLEAAPVAIEPDDILMIHTGYHRYYEGRPQQDLVRYFCMHPGGKLELLEWMLDKKIRWFGIDCGSGDHPINTTIRFMRRDLTRMFEEKVGMAVRRILSALRVHPQALRPAGAQQHLPVPQLRLPGGPDPRRERRRRHRAGAEPALHHRRLPLELRRAGGVPLPDHRVLRLRRGRGRGARRRLGRNLGSRGEESPKSSPWRGRSRRSGRSSRTCPRWPAACRAPSLPRTRAMASMPAR